MACKVNKEYNKGKEFKNYNKRDRKIAVPEEQIPKVCKTVMAMYKAKMHVTLDTLYQKLKEKIATRQSGWKWCQTTL